MNVVSIAYQFIKYYSDKPGVIFGLFSKNYNAYASNKFDKQY